MTIYLVWEEEMYEAPALCGVYDNLTAAREHKARLERRRQRDYCRLSHRSYWIDRVRVATACKRGVTRWPRKQMLDEPQGVDRP